MDIAEAQAREGHDEEAIRTARAIGGDWGVRALESIALVMAAGRHQQALRAARAIGNP